ncbi:MAG: dTDP-4-dehydrorhamnose reductase [Proteobacteria bacterium]|nr:dTDP-4-dehydrorhamnose reductase [Pseudomonadota bacterium]MBU1546796.1 dTDP-4-dehydrorhamnose reductase [Pseudomonadota bacterium]MBU2618119.1 dTDP-4-dehydrorhamnose reductase [Pseudomonadota bacterium]
MRVLLVGGNGQLGRELQHCKPADVEMLALGSADLELREAEAVAAKVCGFRPRVIINAAAYTAVDLAESEREAAFGVNGQGAANLAQAAGAAGAYCLQVSTDFVFDGTQSRPYLPTDRTNPLGVYGASKLAGEQLALAAYPEGVAIVRTAWLYSACGNNFVTTMLRLMGDRETIGVVADQVGTPTWARGLAEALWQMCRVQPKGIYHWTDAGVASWYDFAVAVQEEGFSCGLLDRVIPILPINTVDYPTPAKRPAYSVLDKAGTWAVLGMTPCHWRVALRRMLHEYKENRGA